MAKIIPDLQHDFDGKSIFQTKELRGMQTTLHIALILFGLISALVIAITFAEGGFSGIGGGNAPPSQGRSE